MTLRFGTDGVRGVANVELTPEYALAFGRTVARVVRSPRVVIGRDTRASGPMIEAALCAGIVSEGVDVELLGVCPTPAVAWTSARDDVTGVVISASHNPYGDNGLKVFAPGGLKLSDAEQSAFEPVLELIRRDPHGDGAVAAAAVGQVRTDPAAVAAWADAVAASIDGRRLDGLRVVLDCANGAAHAVAPAVLAGLGVDLVVLSDRPDGQNINAGCGSTHLEPLAAAVAAERADLGLAFDGDADRVLAVDGAGELVDGDQIIALCALDRRARGLLRGDAVVVTVMTNLGFRQAMARHGVQVVETAVGDRHVLQQLEEGGYVLGGEQSGHVIFRDRATTGDGLLTAVQLLDVVARSGRSLAELTGATMTRLPQVLRNLEVRGRATDVVAAIAPEIRAVEARLGERGRVLVRPSGTEPLVRVMVEAADLDEAEAAVSELVEAVRLAAGHQRGGGGPEGH
jgi:phosphoglucosamine mutase